MARIDLIATYLAELPEGREAETAEAFATGQTIGTWTPVPGITEAMRRTHGGRVVEVREAGATERLAGELGAGLWVLRVAFPIANFGPQLPMLFTTLLGNDPSTSISARLVDLQLPHPYVAQFPGPAYGISGWRALTGVQGRPLLLNMIKPCTGYPPKTGARFVREVATGGVDLIKDDELLADPVFSRVRDRARAYGAVLDEVGHATGYRPRYVANVTTRARDLEATSQAALEGGADALMVNVLAVGLDALAALVESAPGTPVFAHTAGVETFTGAPRSGYGHALLLGRLVRLVGADAVLLSTPLASRPLPESVFRATVDWMRFPWWDVQPSMPVFGGGLTGASVPALVDAVGVDCIIGVGGAIQGHPDGPAAGAVLVRAAIDAAVAARLPGSAP